MPITVSNRRDGEWIGDFSTWLRSNAADNEEQQDRLRRNLRLALEQELTPRQKEMVALYFHQRMTIPQIAKELSVNRSTVSRTLRRAKDRLYRCLRYAL